MVLLSNRSKYRRYSEQDRIAAHFNDWNRLLDLEFAFVERVA